jgi:hypothetical protein
MLPLSVTETSMLHFPVPLSLQCEASAGWTTEIPGT